MNSTTSKSSCDRLTRNSKTSSIKSDRIHRAPTPKTVITSKKLIGHGEGTSCSAGVISKTKPATKPKKTTKSDLSFTKKASSQKIDYCKNCGDVTKTQTNNYRPKVEESDDEIKTMIGLMNEKCVKNDNNVKMDKRQKSVQQYYKNENFRLSTESVPDPDENIRKTSLDTIREVSEIRTEDSLFRVYSDSEEESVHRVENIDELKEFRKNNYFECHSATSRIKTKLSATSLRDHRCVYRFYLNDRLFPVPLNADFNNRIRCVECHLPMDVKHETGKSINGTIQAKVKLGTEEAQDMVLLLPVKDTLIIEERRKESKQVDEEVVYFGVIKLSADGNSMFNSTLPYDSLALKYQKGYTEFREDDRYSYKNLDDEDVIVI